MKSTIASMILLLPCIVLASHVRPIDGVESHVNIRSAPEAGATVVGRLQKDSALPLVASRDDWHEVQLESGESGFISADWTTIVSESVQESDTLSAAAATDSPAADFDAGPGAESGPEAAAEPEAQVESERQPHAVSSLDEAPGREARAEPELRSEPENEATIVEPASRGERGPPGPAGPPGPPGAATIKGDAGYLVRFKTATAGTSSQIFDNGNQVGIGTTEPKQRLEVNGNIRIHEKDSPVAGLMITQSSGETGYIMHNRASTMTIGAGSVDRVTIDREGNVGVGVSRPQHPLELANGAHVTAGGVWTNSSSRDRKTAVASLPAAAAIVALMALEPVQFRYRSDPADTHAGFIAEDVPELVATADRQGLSAMDIVAVLTRVIQVQEQRIAALEDRIARED